MCTVNMGEPLGRAVLQWPLGRAVLGAWAKQRPKASRPTQLLAERWRCQRRQAISSSSAFSEQRGDTRRQSRGKVETKSLHLLKSVEICWDAHFNSFQSCSDDGLVDMRMILLDWITSVFLCSFEPLNSTRIFCSFF